MGGGTWVYLGTFAFDKGCNIFNRVILTNHSKHRGVVTADAVRFGGGMGNITRGGQISGLPRALEGARYYTQWQVHLEMLSVKVMERMTIMMILIHVHFILIGLQADLRIYQRKKV